MDGLRVFWTPTALSQRDNIFDYWNRRNRSNNYSQKLNLAIRERLKILKSQPNMGRQTRIEGVRLISMRHYSILYKIHNQLIVVVSFWDNRQDAQKLLKILRGN